MKGVLSSLIVPLASVYIFSQVLQKMSYQAVVRNSGNQLLANQIVGMQFNILQGSATGIAVYVETQTPTTDANGLISIAIDGGTVAPCSFSSIDWSAGVYFLKTETDPAGGTNYSITAANLLVPTITPKSVK